MSQYPRSAATTSDGGYGMNQGPGGNVSRGPSSASATTAGYAGMGAGNGYGTTPFPEPMPSIPSGYASGAGAGAAGAAAGLGAGAAAVGGMSAKQREAYQEQQRLHVANQGGYNAGPSGAGPSGAAASQPMSPTSTEGVTVHTDGGAAPQDDDEPTYGPEIPPT